MIYIGCAIWAYKDWVGDLFPAGSRSGDLLRLYSRRLTCVEGNTTFYATPSPATLERWAEETPDSFRFCLKLPREISHAGPLERGLAATAAFVERVAPLGPRLGPFFLQLPPAYGPARRGDLARWLEAWPAERQIAVEVRHPDWYSPAGEAILAELLAASGAGRVVMDVRPIRQGDQGGAELAAARERKPDVPMVPAYSGGFAFVRYIGHPEPARNEPFLDEWADRLASWLAAGTAIYWFSHCPDEARSPALCRAISARLQARGAAGPLPWEQPPADDLAPPEQLRLL